MSKCKQVVSLDESAVRVWSLRAMKEKLDLGILLYLLYLLGILALGVLAIMKS